MNSWNNDRQVPQPIRIVFERILKKLGTIFYCPPTGRLNSDAFMENILKFKTRHPTYVISDDRNWKPSRLIESPEQIGRRPAWAINNFCWLKSLELARDTELQAFIYLESDCRVGCDDWDGKLFDEWADRYPNGIDIAGSPVCYDAANGGRSFSMRVIEEGFKYQQASGLPMSFHGSKHPYDASGACYYVNGAGAIFDTAAILKLFAGFDANFIWNARNLVSWDLEIGRRLWHNYKSESVNHVGWLAGEYSGFGNAVTTEAERWEMLKSGKKWLTHQHK